MENQGHFQILVQNQKKPQQKKKTNNKKNAYTFDEQVTKTSNKIFANRM